MNLLHPKSGSQAWDDNISMATNYQFNMISLYEDFSKELIAKKTNLFASLFFDILDPLLMWKHVMSTFMKKY